MLNIGWFSTGRDEAAQQLLQIAQENINSGQIKAKISFVFSNREPGEAKESDLFFDLVHSYNIPLICFSHRKFKVRLLRSARNDKIGDGNDTDPAEARGDWRLKYDREVESRIKWFSPGICLLSGYMLIIGEELCRKYNMINLHPAPPGGPIGSWQEVIEKLIESKADKAGAMMHMVTPELDKGPVIGYCVFPIKGQPFDQYWQKKDKDILFKLIRKHELKREFPLIVFTLKALSQKKITILNGSVFDAEGNSINGYDLTEEVEQAAKDEIASLCSQ